MLKKILAFFNLTVSYKTLLFLLIIAICLLLFPMLYIARWDVPSVDDFANGAQVHHAVIEHKSFSEIIQIIIEQTKDTYNQWQGTVSAVFLFNLMPASFGNQYYAIVPYVMIFTLIFGVCFFCNEFFLLFTKNKNFGMISAITILIASTQFLPSPVQGFYWYIGSVYYTFFFGISLILYSLIIRTVKNEYKNFNFSRCFLLSILCVIIASGNLVTALCTIILLTSLLIFLIICRNSS